MQCVPEGLGFIGEGFTVCILGILHPVDRDKRLIWNEDILIQNTQYKGENDGPNHNTKKAKRRSMLNAQLLGFGEMATPAKY